MRKTLLFGLAALLLAAPACRREGGGGNAPGEGSAAVRAAAPAAADPALDELLAFEAGLPAASGPYAALREEPSWKAFSASVGTSWSEFEAGILKPMGSWAEGELWEARERTDSLFYPFGGPDLATAAALFPEAKKIVLLGLEPVGNLPELGRASAEWREEFFADLEELATGYLKRGYFITMDMNDVYSRGKVDGALPVIGLLLKRCGASIVAAARLTPSADGGWVEAPYQRLPKRPHRPYGVRIDYLVPGGTSPRSVYYFSCDVENKAFTAGCPLERFVRGLEEMSTFVKSGSYLLHWINFSTIRNLILDRSLFVLQDDTAVPYRFFKARGWDVRLFGRYATPVKDFTNVEQKDLRAAYEDPHGGVEPLPFRFGYRWKSQIDNLLLAKRPRRPYKVPVIK